MNYDDLRKAAANFDFLVSEEMPPAKAIIGNKQLGSGLLYLANVFSLPDIVANIAEDMIDGEAVSYQDASHAMKILDSFYYRPEFRKQYPDKLMEFGAIKDRLAALMVDTDIVSSRAY